MERRSSDRRATLARITLSLGTLQAFGWIRNISDDGALVKIDKGQRFSETQVGERIELEAQLASGLSNMPSAGKLIRVFEVDEDQYIALRFLDYMGS